MKGRATDEIVYDQMFPRPKPEDPQNFQAFLQRKVIPEVRQETHSFYGHIDTDEAKYPGLDYSHPTHRVRLSRWPWHRRLFRAFDALRLTENEISTLTRWEGTKWAKEKYEMEQGVIIKDTTDEGFSSDESEIDDMPLTPPLVRSEVRVTTTTVFGDDVYATGLADEDEKSDAEDSEDELENVGTQLNQQLRAEAARRDAEETSAADLDDEWEQWLKNALESGELTLLAEHLTQQIPRRAAASNSNNSNDNSSPSSLVPAAIIPQSTLALARAGRWSEVPSFLQPLVRLALSGESTSSAPQTESETLAAPRTSSLRALQLPSITSERARVPWARRTYSDMRPLSVEISTQQA